MIQQVDEEVSLIFKDQSATGAELNESQGDKDSNRTLSYTIGHSLNGDTDQSNSSTVLELDQDTSTEVSSNLSLPPTPQFIFSEPSDHRQTPPAGENSFSLNSPVQSSPQYCFADPAIQSQLSPEPERVISISSPVLSQSLFSQPQTPVKRDTNDRFNGILYHVHANEHVTTIVFSS